MVRVLIAAVFIVACSSEPQPTASQPAALGSGEPTARAEADGVVVELWLDRTQVASGDAVLALVKVTNNRTTALTRQMTTCGKGPAPISVEQIDDANAVPFGEEWAGRSHVFKQELMTQAGLGASRDLGHFLDATVVGRNLPCVPDGREAPLASGSTDQLRLVWQAFAADGSAIVPGPAVVRSRFESIPWRLNRAPVIKVSAAADIEIIGPDASRESVGPTLVDYIDAALSVDAFRDWIETAPGIALEPSYTFWPSATGGWPDVAPYTKIDRHPVVEIGGAICADGEIKEFQAVVVDRFTGNVLGLRTAPSGDLHACYS